MIRRLMDDNAGIVVIIKLEVNVRNERAMRFYTKNGFICLPDNNSDSIIMEMRVVA